MKRFFLIGLFIFFYFKQCAYTQNISISQFKPGDLVDNRFTAFKLSDYLNAEPNFEVKFIAGLADIDIICFYRELGATPIMNMEEIHIYLLKNNKIIHQRIESFGRESNPVFETFHDVFVQYIELKHHWEENDFGTMSYDKTKDFVDGLRFVLMEDKLIPLTELSKSELRIYRNLIFAKYGYVFKSADLSSYFGKTTWYKPNPTVKINEVMSKRDKELANYLLRLEEKLE